MKTVLLVLVCLFGVGVSLSVSMAAEPKSEGSPCIFTITGLEHRYSYFADFAIVITNKSENRTSVHHFDGPPFQITFVHDGKDYRLRHKADWYATEHGASRPPVETPIGAHSTTTFSIDLKGDYVVVSGGRAIPFRDFGINKSGIVKVQSLDLSICAPDAVIRTVEWDGRAIEIR